MTLATWLKRRLRILFRRDDIESDLADEIRLHIDMETEELARQGRTRAEAQREARLLLGGVEQTKEAVREIRPLQWLDGIGLDVKLGLRMLRKSWGLTLVGGLAMVAVIGLCASVFVILDAIGGSTLPLDEGHRVVALGARDRLTREPVTSVSHFERWRGAMRSVEDVAAFQTMERDLVRQDGSAGRVFIARMTAAGFRVARVQPVLGRTLLEEDERAGARPVVVIGYEVWQSRFSGDPGAVGQTVRIDSQEHVVAGVMPKDFEFPVNHQAWTPFQANALNTAAERVRVFGRLAPGITIERARTELASIGSAPIDALADANEPPATILRAYAESFIDPSASPGTLRFIPLLVTLLLIPPCANIAILIYARNVTRTQEFAARFVLGASRGRIVGQLLVEALVLAVMAGGVALMLTDWSLKWAQSYVDQDPELRNAVPYWIKLSLSFESVLYVAGLVVFAAVVAGGLPALRATGRMAQSGFQTLGRSGGLRLSKTWTVLVAAQVALLMAVLPAAIDITWGALSPTIRGTGFASEEYLTARVVFDEEPRAGGRTFAARFRDLQVELIRQVNARTGISGVTVSASAHGMETGSRIEADVAGQASFGVRFNVVDESFFEVFESRLLAGRRFETGDFNPGNPVVIVNRSFANSLVAAPNPLGVRLRNSAENGGGTEAGPWFEIVGVVDDLLPDPRPRMYYAMQPATVAAANHAVSLALRVGRTIPSDLAARLQEIATGLDPSLRIDQIRVLDDVLWQVNRDERIVALGLATVVLIVLLFSVAGIYTMATFAVAQRRHEIAIRSALGAQPRRLIGDLFVRALAPVLFGAAVGVVLALLVSLFVDRIPVIVLAGSAGFMIFVGLLAVGGPARRALRIDATEALRES